MSQSKKEDNAATEKLCFPWRYLLFGGRDAIKQRAEDFAGGAPAGSIRGSVDDTNIGEVDRRLQIEAQRRLDPRGKDEHVVGMEDDVKKLLRESILAEEKKGLSIALVQGMDGIGKSTLARVIYNHPDVVIPGQFDCRGWVVVSSEFTPEETIKQLLFQLSSRDEKIQLRKKLLSLEKRTTDMLYLRQDLKQMLRKKVEGKSYFIVLDDVWEKEHLESLLTAFQDEQDKRSILLITSRNKIIMKRDQYVLEMRLLNSEESWELLLKKAFISTDRILPEELEVVGRQISERCDGLPLAISAVGGLLVETQTTKSGWERILQQLNSR